MSKNENLEIVRALLNAARMCDEDHAAAWADLDVFNRQEFQVVKTPTGWAFGRHTKDREGKPTFLIYQSRFGTRREATYRARMRQRVQFAQSLVAGLYDAIEMAGGDSAILSQIKDRLGVQR